MPLLASFGRAAMGLALLAMAGCAGKTVLMKNDRGDLEKCEVSAASTYLTGIIIRDMTIKQCVAEYQKAGFMPVSGGQ